MKLEELAAELAEERIRPAYLLAGEEALLRDDALAAIRAAVLGGSADDFNHDRLEGRVGAGQLLDAVGTLPVMATRRLVELRDPETQRGRGGGALSDAIAEAVSGLVAREGSTDSVLAVVAASPDRRARWTKAFKDPAAVVECDPPRNAREIAGFVRAEAKRQKVSLGRGVPELLAERVGPHLLAMRQEIAKAALLAGADSEVTRDHVALGTSSLAEESIWNLTDAIGEGRVGDALGVLAGLLRGGAPPPVVLGALASHFRRLLRAKSGAGVSGPPFVRRKLEGQARRYGTGRLRSCLDAIHTTDIALKGAGSLRPEMALERLVLGLSA